VLYRGNPEVVAKVPRRGMISHNPASTRRNCVVTGTAMANELVQGAVG
jgi:hypothetical protein